jgi:hypothetical protein
MYLTNASSTELGAVQAKDPVGRLTCAPYESRRDEQTVTQNPGATSHFFELFLAPPALALSAMGLC